MRPSPSVPSILLLTLFATAPAVAQSVLVEAKTSTEEEVVTIRTDSMRLAVPLHLLLGGITFPDGSVQTTASAGDVTVTSAEIVDGTIANIDISDSAAIADTKLATISTAGKVANSATTATAHATPGTIMARNENGMVGTSWLLAEHLRATSLLVTGTYDQYTVVDPPTTGAGTRLMWYPEKAAFRAGRTSGTHWDRDNIGDHSMAFGSSTTASGPSSTAFGVGTTASGPYSTALGSGTTATGEQAVAMGNGTVAEGSGSAALGASSRASGWTAVAMGAATTASGSATVSTGWQTTAHGEYSTAMGVGTVTNSYASLAIGRYNRDNTGVSHVWDQWDPIFMVGNGTSETDRSNAITMYRNGDIVIIGGYLQSSDIRSKEDVEPLGDVLEAVMGLTPIRYRFRAGTGHPRDPQLGLSAQEIQPLFPELVSRDAGGYLSLSYGNLTAVLVRAIQEQQAEIETLRAQHAELAAEARAVQTVQAELLRRLRALEDNANRSAGDIAGPAPGGDHER